MSRWSWKSTRRLNTSKSTIDRPRTRLTSVLDPTPWHPRSERIRYPSSGIGNVSRRARVGDGWHGTREATWNWMPGQGRRNARAVDGCATLRLSPRRYSDPIFPCEIACRRAMTAGVQSTSTAVFLRPGPQVGLAPAVGGSCWGSRTSLKRHRVKFPCDSNFPALTNISMRCAIGSSSVGTPSVSLVATIIRATLSQLSRQCSKITRSISSGDMVIVSWVRVDFLSRSVH